MNVRFKKSGKGEIAILPRKDYEALMARLNEAEEDAGTARIVARGRRELAAGAPVIPIDVVDRIVKGENPIRVLREWRDMTQVELAGKARLGQGYISDLEGGRRNGTTAALKKIAAVLRVPLELVA